MKKYFLAIVLPIAFSLTLFGVENPANKCLLEGQIHCNGENVPFVNVTIKGTTIGTVSDLTGNFAICNIKKGRYTLTISAIGYKTKEIEINLSGTSPRRIEVELEEDILKLDEVVVSADRGAIKRTQAPVMVNTISPAVFSSTQSVVVGESLNFMPGLRLENDCQNCGFSQVRMNGMEGPYSQILINSRPIFSGLAGVYGLELLPSSIVDRIEVVRGGGSVLYGSNAIAGTINIILKEATRNSYEIGIGNSLTGVGLKNSNGPVADYTLNFNNTMVTDDNQSGFTLYGFMRDRKMFDANGDDFSELAPMTNMSLGTRMWHKLGERSKIALDFFGIREQRDGGNKQELPLHERDVAEAVKHDMRTGAITFERFFRQFDVLSVYASGQYLKRDSYYGANQSIDSYGKTTDYTFNNGIQYKAHLQNSTLTAGIESTIDRLKDIKLGYPDYLHPHYEINSSGDTLSVAFPHLDNATVSNQALLTAGAYLQHDLTLGKLKTSVGIRAERYSVKDRTNTSPTKSGTVLVPRLSLMYNATSWIQTRLSYSQGYRAPQVFDEDLHIETSGSRQVINRNDPNLKQETSHSVMASIDINKQIGNYYFGFLAELFYTRLNDPFVNEIGTPDANGTVIYTRKNAEDGARVSGLNIEIKFRTLKKLSVVSGFTIQSSKYDTPQEFNEREFFRTPSRYGYLTVDWDPIKNLCLSVSGNYTGPMLAPYFGPNTNPDVGELRKTPDFYDIGIKLAYNLSLSGKTLQLYIGSKNIFNSYQNDFDTGINRDPSYIYGPLSPRTVYFGLKLGNLIN